MDRRIKEIIDLTKEKFGLGDYFLQTHSLSRNVNIFNQTVYTLAMEWFPNDAPLPDEEGTNPKGTAVMEYNIQSRQFERAIFVGGKTYANGVKWASPDTKKIIQWIEEETGLKYGKQFQLAEEKKGEYHFAECIDGKAVSPSGHIEIKLDEEGNLTLFSVSGHIPAEQRIEKEEYTLSFEKIEEKAKEQVKLLDFPSFKKERVFPIYAVEELYITNDGNAFIPFEFIVDVRSYLEIGERLKWVEPIDVPFERKEIDWTEEITAEQAFSCEASPDSLPITKDEQTKCIRAVTDFLQQEYPNDSGRWVLKTLHRDKGYIQAILRTTEQDRRVFQRKIKIMIDRKSFEVINYFDNQSMLDMLDRLQVPEKVTVTKEEAFEKLRGLFELNPYYVYDFERKKYILCGKLDGQYGVDASSGEVILLADL